MNSHRRNTVRGLGRWLVVATMLGCALPGMAAAHTRAQLLVDTATVQPGDRFLAGVLLTMESGWHTYWTNAGDSGDATKITWDLPRGVSAGAPQWPVPEKLTLFDLTTYVYHDEVLLLVPITVGADVPAGPLDLKASLAWLECATTCLQGSARVAASLRVGSPTQPSADASRFRTWQERLPRTNGVPGLRAAWEGPPSGDTRPFVIEWKDAEPVAAAEFFPYAAEGYEVLGPTELIAAAGDVHRLRKQARSLNRSWPRQISGVLADRLKPAPRGYEVALPLDSPAGEPAAAVAAEAGPASRASLAFMLFSAFLGGLILNVMPCVLPVIALKVLAFLKQAEVDPSTVRKHGLLYGAGVLVSFLVLAGLVIALQQGGHLASWGMQFQSAGFLVVTTTLVTLVALNLFGLFEVSLGGRTLGAAASLAAREGSAGAFFNGVLATTLATPCTAPYLAAAVGFAFSQSPAIIVLMFAFIGVGLASPYVVLSFVPGLAVFLPRPGTWMERFKVAMGFPMLAAGVWLLSLLTRHYGGAGVLWVGMFLLGVALSAWIWGAFVQRGRLRPGLGALLVLFLTAGAYYLFLERLLQWRGVSTGEQPVALTGHHLIDWQPWSPEAVRAARSQARPVLVDFTADWCVTCQANKKTSLEIPSVQKRLKEINAVALLGDYTLADDRITQELARFGRAGVPLVLVYPRNTSASPRVLPELLTPSVVLKALDQAAQ